MESVKKELESITPLKNRLLVTYSDPSRYTTTVGGNQIEVVEDAMHIYKQRILKAQVYTAGEFTKTVRSGDTIAMRKQSGNLLKISGLKVIQLTEDDVLGIFKNNEEEFIPLADRVLVKTIKEESTTSSGLIVPTTDQPLKGTIIAIGDGNLQVEPGYTVMYGPTSGTEMEIRGEVFVIMRESEIYGIVNTK